MAIVAVQNGARLKFLITITAGTPILLILGPDVVKADRLFVQALAGGTGKIFVYDDVQPPTPTNPAGTLPANIAATCGPPEQLAAATATAPGGSYEENPAQDPYNFLDLRTYAIDGLSSGDTVLVDARLKI